MKLNLTLATLALSLPFVATGAGAATLDSGASVHSGARQHAVVACQDSGGSAEPFGQESGTGSPQSQGEGTGKVRGDGSGK